MTEGKELLFGVEYPMIFVPPGSFMMGSKDTMYSQPVREVTFKKCFFIGKYPVTQALWKAVMGGENPSVFKGDSRPVENVSWKDVQTFIRKLNDDNKPKNKYRLPSESEWEYAARGGEAGSKEKLTFSGSNRLEEVGWYTENSGKQTKPVGLKMGNQLGIHDMSGNVWEWCADEWADKYIDHPLDGSAFLKSKEKDKVTRVVRGGSWDGDDDDCSVFDRNWYHQDDWYDLYVGFRLARY